MRNVRSFLVLFFIKLIFLILINCYGLYHLELDDTIDAFFNKKSKIFTAFPGTNQLTEFMEKQKNPLGEILNKLESFNKHNDREELDCCQACYFIKILNDKDLCFSENDKKIILQALEIMTTWFIHNSFYIKDMEEAEKLFRNFNFNQLFVFVEDLQTKKESCIIL